MRLRTTALIVVSISLALAGCGRPADGKGVAADSTAAPSAQATAPETAAQVPVTPARDAVQPISNTATAITGAAEFGPQAYRFARGQTYEIAPEGRVAADVQWSADGGSWADLLGLDPGGEVELVRVTAQTVDPGKALNGSLCGSGRVRWIATGRSADDVGAEVSMAAFSGARPPGPLGRDEDLCATFSYAAGN